MNFRTMTVATVFSLLALLAFSFHSTAAEIYRWKDKNGVVHYGDRSEAPNDGEKVVTKDSRGINEPAVKASQGEPAHSGGGVSLAGVSPDKIAMCAVHARAMVDASKSEWVANANKIKSACPGIGFECATFNHHPEKNKCEPFELNGGRIFFKDVKRDFPIHGHP